MEKQSEVLQNVVHTLNEITLLLQNVGEEVMGTAVMSESSSLPLTNKQVVGRLEDELMEIGFRTKLPQSLNHLPVHPKEKWMALPENGLGMQEPWMEEYSKGNAI